jgi:hypothetical protein
VGRGTPRACWWQRGRHGDCRCRGGVGGGSDEIPVTFGSPTALTGDGGGVGRRRGAVVSSPTTGCASPLDQLGFRVLVGCTAQSTWLSVPPAPTSFYMAQGDGGPPAIWARRPRSGRVCEGKARLRSVGARISKRSN